MYAHYSFDEDNNQEFALISSADLTGLGSTSDLTASDAFEVVGVARLLDVSDSSLGTLGGYNLSSSKPSGFAGA